MDDDSAGAACAAWSAPRRRRTFRHYRRAIGGLQKASFRAFVSRSTLRTASFLGRVRTGQLAQAIGYLGAVPCCLAIPTPSTPRLFFTSL